MIDVKLLTDRDRMRAIVYHPHEHMTKRGWLLAWTNDRKQLMVEIETGNLKRPRETKTINPWEATFVGE